MEIDTPTTASKKANENVTPSAGSETASKHPDMELAQSIHKAIMISSGQLTPNDIQAIGIPSTLIDDVMKQIGTKSSPLHDKELGNPSLYRHLKTLLNYNNNNSNSNNTSQTQSPYYLSEEELQSMQQENLKTFLELEKKVEDAKENSGDMEVLEARFEVARFAAKCMTKEEALDAYDKVLALPKLSSGKVMDALMESSRVASFYGDLKKNKELVDKISKLAEESGDWDRRNRLKVYSSLTKLLSRDVKGAATLLIDCIATFSCTEMCSYTEFLVYTIISNLLYLPRTELKSKIVDGSEIRSVASEIPVITRLVNTLYDCDYKGYLQAMVEVQPHLVANRFLQPHCGFIMRELHVLGYKQFLDSYKSVTLQSMATSFGISVEFLDLQLSRFIAAGRLTAKIDKFGGVVETNRPDLKNAQYREMIQKGDLLLNRIQKLARVVDL
jgi:26S proteasome regulatory subunit N7